MGEADTLDSIASAYHRLGHPNEAVFHYEQALDRYRNLGHRYHEADTLSSLGDVYFTDGNTSAARQAWHGALAILEQLDHPDADKVRAKVTKLDGRMLAGPDTIADN